MQLYGIYDGRKISKFVFVESSFQTAGYPILTVGRYYAPTVAASAPPPLPIRTEDGLIPPLPTLRPR